MPYSPATGMLGLQGRHQWNGGFVINNTAAGLPYADLDRITGLFSLPELDDLRDPRIGASGEVLYPSYTRGKTITYEGRLVMPNEEYVPYYRATMLYSFSNQSDEGSMAITPHPSWGSGGWYYWARVLALDIDDEITTESLATMPSPYQLHFILSLRMKDNSFVQF